MRQQAHPLGTELHVARALWASGHDVAGGRLHDGGKQVHELGVLRADLGLSARHIHPEGGVGGEVEVGVLRPYA